MSVKGAPFSLEFEEVTLNTDRSCNCLKINYCKHYKSKLMFACGHAFAACIE
jgi:hypothetical protein